MVEFIHNNVALVEDPESVDKLLDILLDLIQDQSECASNQSFY